MILSWQSPSARPTTKKLSGVVFVPQKLTKRFLAPTADLHSFLAVDEPLQHLHEESAQHPDIADRASTETERAVELRARDRQRKLIAKIDAALTRLDDGTYGYCEETGEPISLKRLDARPIATLSVEAQERHERRERFYSND